MTTVSVRPFGSTGDGKAVTQYTLKNENGMCVQLLSYACAVQRMVIPDKNGVPRDVVLGYDTVEGYENGSSFFGAFVGRYANRIKNAAFPLGGKMVRLRPNAGAHHLHGAFARRVFDGEMTDGGVVFRYVSPPEEEGYPGTLTGEVRYSLTADNALVIAYTATADADTVVNLTNHAYFNLNGQDGSDVLNHLLQIDADSYTDIDGSLIPIGKINSVDGTALDFRSEKPIGADITQLTQSGGYD
ncbi:MAG: galactose mutarotase, partial [Ruminococcus sp.]|nr:galactose mutarotase [Ruminococcus sp.]